MMQRSFIFLFIACAISTCYGLPADKRKDTEARAEPKPDGVGAFAYQDSSGRRYGGTYGLRDGEIIPDADEPIPSFVTDNHAYYNYGGFNNLFPEYFRNFHVLSDARKRRELWPLWPPIPPIVRIRPLPPIRPLAPILPKRILHLTSLPPIEPLPPLKPLRPLLRLLQEEEDWHENIINDLRDFQKNLNKQQRDLDEAMNAFPIPHDQPDIAATPYSDGRFPTFPPFRPFRSFNFGFNNMMPNFGSNSAFASGYIGPDRTQQAAIINPQNPMMPNINIENRFADLPSSRSSGGPGFQSVHTSSFSSTSDVNGQKVSNKGASTIINDNGKITNYSVHD